MTTLRPDPAAARPRTRAAGLCAHCSLPLPSRPVEEDTPEGRLTFCCGGCRTVYRIVGAQGGESGWHLARLALAGLLSGNIMMFQFLLYFDSYRALGEGILQTTSWIMLAFSAAVYLLLGVPMLRSAWSEARRGRIGTELLIAAGSLVAILASARATLRASHLVYYDSATMILVLVTLGSFLDAKSREKATDALRPIVAAGVRLARVERGEDVIECAAVDVRDGDRVRVRAGEEIPADGTVVAGTSDVEESALTGESRPRSVEPGDRVFAGSTAVDGALTVRSSGITETLADRIARLAQEARAERAPIAIAADRATSVFVPAVLCVSLFSLLGWGLLRHAWAQGGLSALAVLVVACPCALGLATPLATTIALSRAASRGIIVRSGQALEILAGVRLVAFDKTGTLTVGKAIVEETDLSDRALAAAAAVENSVSHPFARAIVEEARRRGLREVTAQGARAVPGGGAEGSVDGARLLLGTREFLRSSGLNVPASDAALSEVWCAFGEKLEGSIRLRDPVRPEAGSVVGGLGQRGMATVLLSGDTEAIARRIGEEAGITDIRAALAPGAKVDAISGLRKIHGCKIAMVGDGVNDAPALDAADVGIAFGRAADLAREHADVSILREDLTAVPELFDLARRTFRTIKFNLAWAFGYNVVGIGLAAAGMLSPIVAALAMVLSSLFVVGSSMRLRSGR